jgi:hypothetical protein
LPRRRRGARRGEEGEKEDVHHDTGNPDWGRSLLDEEGANGFGDEVGRIEDDDDGRPLLSGEMEHLLERVTGFVVEGTAVVERITKKSEEEKST